jgi:hypothetical protein
VTSIQDDLEGFYIDNKNTKSQCDKWYFSLFLPILYINGDIKSGIKRDESSLTLKIPFINYNKEIKCIIYDNVYFLQDSFTGVLIKPKTDALNKCFFGISPNISGYENLNEDDSTLNNLKNGKLIDKKIFSLDVWEINTEYNSEIKSSFYLGDSNDIFNANDKIVATCNSYQNNSHWGCSFKEMVFNNMTIQLKNETNTYKIYLASETHNLIFPYSFIEVFKELSNQDCDINDDRYLTCKKFFNNNLNYIPLILTEENEKFIITGEIDNIIRFNENEQDKKNILKVTFGFIDYIVLPLSVFKNFHLQFDSENNLISFYANESSILEVKQNEEESSSSAGIIILIIILILLVLGLGVYCFFIKRRNVEKSINNFSKFEDEEDYTKINEKKVF